MRAMRLLQGESGQGTVEAALVIPVLFVLMLMLIQPGIVLYDHIVMRGAAAEACRVLATTGEGGSGKESCETFVRNRLAAVPQHEFFHVHEGGCSWQIDLTGDEDSDMVAVEIRNEIRPLPLFDAAFSLVGATNGNGNLTLSASAEAPGQPGWVRSSAEGSPADWVKEWS